MKFCQEVSFQTAGVLGVDNALYFPINTQSRPFFEGIRLDIHSRVKDFRNRSEDRREGARQQIDE